ncbi:hypothetical protein [Longimicrobium sp.]|uniref:hypothetical protein n=1 Tax=Longimicrobium sp. TaxID=2029185 RepID=UPI002E37148D|nr:hypothetical protein [Longimicrobium sp.]HEX6037767.1 hypothetical protein [Longimicrobium sp.]
MKAIRPGESMLDERRYGDDEVAEIFRAAATPAAPAAGGGSAAVAPAAGFTLAELQSIGGEAGLAPERVAQAAAALDLRRNVVVRRDLGIPVSVGRTVELPRAPMDREWEMIVADLRDTFRARGRVEVNGDLREWRNGNLHAYVEPTPAGYRLRIRTTKGDAAGTNRMGAMSLVAALVTLVIMFASGTLAESFFVPMMLALMGAGTLGYNALRLPGWASEREAQMEEVAARAVSLLSAPAPTAANSLPGTTSSAS